VAWLDFSSGAALGTCLAGRPTGLGVTCVQFDEHVFGGQGVAALDALLNLCAQIGIQPFQ